MVSTSALVFLIFWFLLFAGFSVKQFWHEVMDFALGGLIFWFLYHLFFIGPEKKLLAEAIRAEIEWLRNEIDGCPECRSRDTKLNERIRILEAALQNAGIEVPS